MNDKLLRKKDIVEVIGAPKSTVSDWIKDFSSYIPTVKDGATIYYKPETIDVLNTVKELREDGYDKTRISVMLAEKGFAINSDDLEGRIRTAVKTADRKSEQEGRDALMAMSHMMGQLTERMSQYENENKELQQQIEQVSSKQDGRISDLEKMLADQQKYIDEKLNERERILTESLRRSLDETQKMIAATQEQELKKENKGFFARFFGKKG
jgi:hypothetical protein